MQRTAGFTFSGLVAVLFLFLFAAPALCADWNEAYCSNQNTGNTDVYTNQYMSNGNCTNHCRDLSSAYAFAVIQYKDCYCSNLIPYAQDNISRCQKDCPGYGEENCGSIDDGLYIYIQNGRPSGTAPGPTSAQPTSKTVSSSAPPPPSPPPATTTDTSKSSSTPVTSLPSSSTMSSIVPPPPDTTTVMHTTIVVSSHVVIVPQPSFVSPSITSTKPSSSQPPPSQSPISLQVSTENGNVVTRTVYLSPSSGPSSSSAPVRTDKDDNGPNIGAIAGGVVGGVLGLLAIVGGLIFVLWRRRRNQREAQEAEIGGSSSGGITRNTSTMSKAGLLGTSREMHHQYPPQIATNMSTQNSRYGDHESISPISNRRNSQPLVIDSRLNPNAVMTFAGASLSRESVASLDDSRDYGRQLNVRNPDP
ncbi:hypothetical protein IQ06DRAFT_308086 [Phaeosphaeriaceae sp. SRC1lsM3a]|nr:hypothetical protein IQ06DRAFT_308086 [Stagonospora sp. SRC1lsM3a]